MCGRYYVDDETAREIEKLIEFTNKTTWNVKKQMSRANKTVNEIEKQMSLVNETPRRNRVCTEDFASRDIHPTELAPVLVMEDGRLGYRMLRWGLPGYQKKGSGKSGSIIFNARSESAMEKPTFRTSVRSRRVIIPAAWFYEWNRNKEKNIFRRSDSPVLYMAGCCSHYEDGDRFVIFTTAANESMAPVHDRMPLILEPEELGEWILDDNKTEAFLRKIPCTLERRSDYEQMSLFVTV